MLPLHRIRIALALSLASLLVVGAGDPAADQPFYLCERVIDGNTIELSTIGKVRLIGVDVPGTPNRRKHADSPRNESSDFLRTLIEGRQVRLEYDSQRMDNDKHTLAYVYLPDSTFVNEALIRLGQGRVQAGYPFKHFASFWLLERGARESNLGIWASQGESNAVQNEASSLSPARESGEITVFVTRTGSKYHRGGCRYLARSSIPISITDAVERYGPCSVCDPPTLSSSPRSSLRSPERATPNRCQATTKKGTQCKRNARPGSSYCWQHG